MTTLENNTFQDKDVIDPGSFQPFWVVTKLPEIFTDEPRPILKRETPAPEMMDELIVANFKKCKDPPKLLEVLATSTKQGLIRSLGQIDAPERLIGQGANLLDNPCSTGNE